MAYEHRAADTYIETFIDAAAISAALELGIIDHLLDTPAGPGNSIAAERGITPAGWECLAGLLEANGVVCRRDGEYALTDAFRAALRFRDLMEARLRFARLVLPDLANRFPQLVADPRAFARASRVFELFDYGRCSEYTEDNYDRTREWMDITTTLTRYEAAACLEHVDADCCRTMLDIGGNSGEFSRQACRQYPHLRATVFDLPLVCDIGREYLQGCEEADRVAFVKGDARRQQPPAGFDFVTFKSVLHDWPEDEAAELIGKGRESLNPGGTLLIFEREQPDYHSGRPPYHVLPYLLFCHHFRCADFYVRTMERLGFADITVTRVALEMPFMLVTAKKQ